MVHPNSRSGHEEVDHQHRELNQLVVDIRAMLRGRTASTDQVEQQIRHFAVAANRHFELEEEGGYFSDAVAQAPRLSRRAGELQREHEEMSAKLDTLLHLIHDQSSGPAWWDEVSERFEEIAHQMAQHEAAEVKLLQEAYIDDIGAED